MDALAYLTDPHTVRALRAVAWVMAALVAIDSVGIIMSAREQPAHKPKGSAAAWLVLSMGVLIAFTILLDTRAPLVGQDSPMRDKLAIVILYAGIIGGSALRAIVRAKRPGLTISAAAGMLAGALFFAGLAP